MIHLLKLKQAGFSELAYQFAQLIYRLSKSDDQLVAITAALLSEAMSQGNMCLNLKQTNTENHILSNDLPEQSADWINHLKHSHLVGETGEYKPLILTEDGLLYVYRYWQDEQTIARGLQQRLAPLNNIDLSQMHADFANWQSHQPDQIDWQKVAVFMALTRQFCIISGGPGTGKTTIVLRLLQLLNKQNPKLNITLAAPTGKAAARLQQAVFQADNPYEAKTLHRLLGISEHKEQGRYNSQNPLPIDVLIIDEASMIDSSLMALLLSALPQHARLILLGDSQQLASVESGSILSNLCQNPNQFSAEFAQSLATTTAIKLPVLDSNANTSNLVDSVVALQHSYRFDEHSQIGQLACAVQSGNIQAVYNVLTDELWQSQCNNAAIQKQVLAGYQAYFEAVHQHQDPIACLDLFERYRVLCALKQGPQSVTAVNQLIERFLQSKGWRTQQAFYHGRPIMIGKNDYQQGLFNGDTGLILQNSSGQLHGYFLIDNIIKQVAINRLPAHDTAFAITIHKSQGSEFDNISILLPEEDSPLLNRELLYTAITRSKNSLMLICTDLCLTKTVEQQHQRESGLAKLMTSSAL